MTMYAGFNVSDHMTHIRDAIARTPMVIIGGGDGSLASNVDFFVGHDTVFAIVPLGTANSVAGAFGISKDAVIVARRAIEPAAPRAGQFQT